MHLTEINLTRQRASTSSPWRCVWRNVAIVTKSVHRLQNLPIVHKKRAPSTIPPTYNRVRVVVWRGTDRHTHGCDHYTFRLGYASCEM